ncbi:MAG: SMI1/KNR4 family protein [Deltaproteobacteria bacterium]|nr:SMI1/KNR4 family protein [Deltaproteobacteria bacterium]
MSTMDIRKWLETTGTPNGVSDDQASRFATRYGLALPPDYLAFLRASNGAEGPIGAEAYIALWSLDDVAARNEEYQVGLRVPGVLLIGSDGGGEGFGFDFRDPSTPLVNVPLVGMAPGEVKRIAPTFTRFLEMLESSEWLPF